MFSTFPTLPAGVDVIPGLFGAISIGCWIIVFIPQIYANWKRKSTEAVSPLFPMIWLSGDICNVVGAILQDVQGTVIALAVYYAFADVTLIGQCISYGGFRRMFRGDESDVVTDQPATAPSPRIQASERTALLSEGDVEEPGLSNAGSSGTNAINWTGLSPAVPHIPPVRPEMQMRSTLQSLLFKFLIVLGVCASSVVSWVLWVSFKGSPKTGPALETNTLGQIFGGLCAVFYIGARIPQLYHNIRRGTTEGLDPLFFTFACMGNVTFIASILALVPHCEQECGPGEEKRLYGKHVLINVPWLLGSSLTLLQDLFILGQAFYFDRKARLHAQSRSEQEGVPQQPTDDEGDGPSPSHDPRPLLQRGDSDTG